MRRSTRNRVAAATYWLLPSLICIWLHRDGLHAWFQADDFAFLGANTEYYNAKTFWHALFQATPQGGFRPWSERLFFFAFWHWFGWNAIAYRVFVMATQCVNLALLSALVLKLSGSKLAGFVAPLLWVANSALVPAMAWTCAFEEILCATFLLAGLVVLAYGRGGRIAYLIQLALFLLGFGVLELNMVYPALAAVYAFFYNRRLLLWTVPMFALSAAYFALHTVFVPLQSHGAYQPHYGPSIVATFFKYWQLVLAPPYGIITVHPVWAAALLITTTLGIVLFLISEWRNHRFAPAFFACWFVIALAPMLPFRDHVTHYYLTVPLVGFASIAALAIARWKRIGASIAALYFAIQIPTLAAGEQWYLERSRAARTLILGVKQVHEWYPEKEILLADISSALYSFTVADAPFRLIPNARVYLAPEALQQITGLPPNIAPVSRFALPPGPTRHALANGSLVVYSAAGNRLQEVTASYTAHNLAGPNPELPRRVDVGLPAMAYLLSPEWYPLEGPYRWMPRRATLRMAGPKTEGEKLYVSGFAAPESLRMQPLEIAVFIDSVAAGHSRIASNDASFSREFTLPAELAGRPSLTVTVEVSHVFPGAGNGRELGLAFGTFEIR